MSSALKPLYCDKIYEFLLQRFQYQEEINGLYNVESVRIIYSIKFCFIKFCLEICSVENKKKKNPEKR